MKKFYTLLALGILALASVAHADFTESDWEYLFPVVTPENRVVGAYLRMNIPREVSMASQNNLADVRIISGNRSEVPYQLVVESETTRNAFVQSALRDLGNNGGETMFILDLGTNRSLHDHLVITTGSKNFKRPVAVYASDENLYHQDERWRLLSATNYIYNFYDQLLGFNAGKGDVFYPESTSRYLRVVIGRGEGAEVSVDNVRVLRTLSKEAQLSQMEVIAQVTQNSKEQSTELTVDLGASGVPTRSVTLSTTEMKNFNRRVVIQGSNDQTQWNMLGQGYVFQLDTPLFKGSSFSIPYSETTMRYIRVIIFNQDDQPIEWARPITLVGVLRTVVFQFDAGQTYALYVGNKNASAPRYDIARFFEYIETATFAPAGLKPLMKNPSYAAPRPKEVPYTERNAYVLNSVLVLLVGIITFLLIAYLKKIKLAKHTQ